VNWLTKTINYLRSYFYQKDIKSYLPFLLSLLLHLIFLFVQFEKAGLDKVVKKNKTEKIRLILKDSKKKQIVNSEKSKLKAIPKENIFLGKKTQVHDRQTKAKIVKSFNEGGKGVKNGLKGVQGKKALKKPKKVSKSKTKLPTLSDLNAIQDIEIEKYIKPSKAAAKGHKAGNENKKGLSSNNDYLENVPLGDFTKLNTTEFKFYGFYFRIRQQLEQHWGSLLQEKAKVLYKKRRRIASDAKITSLKVTIDSKGNIIGVILKSTSGIQELDDAAIESFNKAGPFPNPPKGMLVDGKAIIEWGFVVKG